MRFLSICVLWVGLMTHALADSQLPPVTASQLEQLITTASRHHPRVRAAEQVVEQALARYRADHGFFDPRLVMSTGAADQAHAIGGVSDGVSVPAETVGAEGAIERAFLPGFYGSVGAAQRYRWNALNGDDLNQSLLGAQLRIPLWRDRGFREYRLSEQQNLYGYLAAHSQHVAVLQELRREVTLAYIDLQEAYALLAASEAAAERVQAVLKEAQELVRLEVVPEYQLNQAHLEVSLREEELLGAREAVTIARLALASLTGPAPLPAELAIPTERFIDWAQDNTLPEQSSHIAAFHRRGVWQQLAYQQIAAHAGIDLAEEQRKPDLSLKASVAYQAESSHRFFGDDALLGNDTLGASVQLVYTQPLGFTREDAAIDERLARLHEIEAVQEALQLDIRTGLATAAVAYQSARQRLALAQQATEAARATLDAEGERFRLGEGRSRQVLDAEKDLTATIRLQARNAARLLRAHAEHAFHAGYPGTNLWGDTAPDGDKDPTP